MSGLRLVPLWLYDHMAHGQTLTSVNGEAMTVADGYDDEKAPKFVFFDQLPIDDDLDP